MTTANSAKKTVGKPMASLHASTKIISTTSHTTKPAGNARAKKPIPTIRKGLNKSLTVLLTSLPKMESFQGTIVPMSDPSMKKIMDNTAKRLSQRSNKKIPSDASKKTKLNAESRLLSTKDDANFVTIARLSDPAMTKIMASTVKRLSKDHDEALRFLQEIGMATPTGRLSKRFGG